MTHRYVSISPVVLQKSEGFVHRLGGVRIKFQIPNLPETASNFRYKRKCLYKTTDYSSKLKFLFTMTNRHMSISLV